ncbi:unnamed protein product [Bemisia tabaci]|uniref:Uncharacterized protein n=1 Tax=Bemisia tabaci TaxID=7038 RepID=A0A9P0AE67_BEMTA|nr:unnamed protein product [Bemisia tabaci]
MTHTPAANIEKLWGGGGGGRSVGDFPGPRPLRGASPPLTTSEMRRHTMTSSILLTVNVKNAASSVFGEIRSNNETFVDKTLWLKEFYELNTSSKTHLSCSPLAVWENNQSENDGGILSITNNEKQARELFEDTLIHSKEKNFFDAHFRKYPVIYFNFQPLLSTTNCIEKEVYNLKEQYVKYFGITETEVEHLLEKSSLADNLPRFKFYYDGYSIAHSPKKIFNTISPTKFVKNRKFAPYWAESVEPLKNDFLGLFSRPLIGSLIEKAIFWDMMKLPEFPHLKPAIGKDMFHAVRGNATVDPEVVASAGAIFFNYLYESGYIGMITVDGFLATNQDAAFALGTTLARDSNFYQNARNISSAAKMKLVKAVKNLALSKETMMELAAAIHGLYHPACSLVTEERVSFVGPIFTILAYEDPEAFEEVISPLRVAFQPTKPDVVLLRKDFVAFVFALRRNESAREAAEAALSSEYEYVFEKDFKGVKIKSTMFVGINLDVDCRVSVGFGEEGIQAKEIKELSSPIDETG